MGAWQYTTAHEDTVGNVSMYACTIDIPTLTQSEQNRPAQRISALSGRVRMSSLNHAIHWLLLDAKFYLLTPVGLALRVRRRRCQ